MSNEYEQDLERTLTVLQQSAEVNADTATNVRALTELVSEQRKELENLNAIVTQHDDKFTEISNKFIEIQDNEHVNPTQLSVLKDHATNRIRILLGTEKGSADWILYSKIFYCRLWSDFKRHFSIPAYGWLRRVDYQIGLDIIDGWIPKDGVQALKDFVIWENTQKEKEHLKAVFRAKDELDQEDGE